MSTWKDPIVSEVRAIRTEYAKRFGYDLDRMVKDIQRQAQKARKLTKNTPVAKPKKPRRRPAA